MYQPPFNLRPGMMCARHWLDQQTQKSAITICDFCLGECTKKYWSMTLKLHNMEHDSINRKVCADCMEKINCVGRDISAEATRE